MIINTGKDGEIWKHFEYIQDRAAPEVPEVDGQESPKKIDGFVACKKCFKVYSYSAKGTGNYTLNGHARACLPDKGQPTIVESLPNPRPLITARDKSAVADSSVSFVCRDLRSYQSLEKDGMLDLAKSLIKVGQHNPKAVFDSKAVKELLPTRNTVNEKHRRFRRMRRKPRGIFATRLRTCCLSTG